MPPIVPKDEAMRLRQQSGDNAVYTHLLKSDPVFRKGVERMQSMNPNMGAFEKLKMPSYALDIYYGQDSPKADPVSTNAAQNIMRDQPDMPMPQEGSAIKQAVDTPLSFAGETLMNVPGSALNLGKSLAGAVMHPIETGKTLLQLGLGGGANTIETIAGLAGVKNAEDIFDFESEDVAKAVGDFYVERYGSMEAAAKTLRDDPVGFLSDAATVVAGIGGIIKGGATAAGVATGAATKTATALTKTGKAIRIAQNVGEAIMQKGIKMEPVVIAGKGVFMVGRGIKSGITSAVGPESLIHKSLKLQPNQMRNFMKESVAGGETPAGYILRKGLSGSRENIMDDLEKIARKSKETVDSELASARQTFDLIDDVPHVFQALDEVQKFFSDVPGLESDLSRVKELINKERLNLTEINEVKRMMDRNLRMFSKSNDPLMAARAQGLRNIRDGVKTFIEDTAEQKGLQDIRLLNKDTQLSHALLDDMEAAAIGKFSNNAVSLMDLLTFGVSGGMSGDLLFSAGVVMGRRMLGSTTFRTTLAKYLNRLNPEEMKPLLRLMKTGKHTRESIRLTRKVVAQTAEDIKQKRIGYIENSLGGLQAAERMNAGTSEQKAPIEQPSTDASLPEEIIDAPLQASV